MKKIQYILLLVLMLLVSSHSFAQHDTDFWFAVPRYLSTHTMDYDPEAFFFVLVCHEGEANVTISFPAMPTVNSLHYKVTRYPAKVYIGHTLDCINYNTAPPFNIVSQRGIHIESDIPIQCYYHIPGANAASYTLKGKQGLGKEFIITMQHKLQNCSDGMFQYSLNSFEIVATEDNTTVTIYPSNPYYQYQTLNDASETNAFPSVDRQSSDFCQTTPVKILLNKGETYAMRSCSSLAGEQLTGSRIIANKPIAVTGNDDSVDYLDGCDSQGDQLFPVSMAGTEFVVADGDNGDDFGNIGWGADNYNFMWHGIYVYTLYDDTKVTFTILNKDSTLLQEEVGLDKNSRWNPDYGIMRQTAYFLQTTGMDAVYVKSSKPILLSQVTGYTAEGGIAMIPPLTAMGMTEFTCSYEYLHISVLHLITKNEYANGFLINGETFPAIYAGSNSFPVLHRIPGTGYSYIALRFDSNKLLHITNYQGPFQAGVRYYANAACSFTYFADLPSKGQVVITDIENPYNETNNTPGTLGDNGKEELFYPNVIRMGYTYYTCPGNDVQFEAKMSDGTAISSPQWTLPNGQVRSTNTLSIHGVTSSDVGEYSLRGTVEGETVEASFSLTVPDSAESNVITRVAMCEGATYTWPINNRQYTAPAKDTIYVSTLIDGQQLSGNCTTNLILDLQANNGLDTTYLYYSLTPGDTLNWYGEKITGSSAWQRLIETQEGCSTLVYLIVKANDGIYDEGVDVPNIDELLLQLPDIPIQPVEPEKPTQPEEPETPTQPEEPENPSQPENPETPTQPEEPETPDQPVDPENPIQPENPGQSEEIDPESFDVFVYQDNTDAVLVVNTGKHEANINVYSTIGTRVFSAHKDLNTDWFVMPLPVGTYIALIELDNKLTVKKKFVIRE